MNPSKSLTSSLAERMEEFIAFKRMQGYEYRDGADALRQFDAFLTQSRYTSRTLQPDILERYADALEPRRHSTRAGRLSTVRQFSLYLHAREPESVLLPKRLVPRRPRTIRFYPLSASNVGELMAATAILICRHELLAECIRFLIGMLYSTGLRISEALALTLGDIDPVDSTLFVRRGKFRKERLVPMSPSTHAAMDRWLQRRARYAPSDPSTPLFVAGTNRWLTYRRAQRLFRGLCIHCGLEADPPPRLHDLRHNYACACIAQWRHHHEDVNALLPVLANAMGHTTYHDTEIYIHIDAAALCEAGERFKQHVQHPREPQS